MAEINFEYIGKRIRKAREAEKLTQEQLAEKVGVGSTHISHIETGNTIPSLKLVLSIINTLGVSADEILCENLVQARHVYEGEIAEAMKDCSEQEIRLIHALVLALKEQFRREGRR